MQRTRHRRPGRTLTTLVVGVVAVAAGLAARGTSSPGAPPPTRRRFRSARGPPDPPRATASPHSVGFSPRAGWCRCTARRATASRGGTRPSPGGRELKAGDPVAGTRQPQGPAIGSAGRRNATDRGENRSRRRPEPCRQAEDPRRERPNSTRRRPTASATSPRSTPKLAYLKVQTSGREQAGLAAQGLEGKGVTVADEDIEKAELLQAQADAEEIATKATRDKTDTTYRETEKSAQAKIDAAKAELEQFGLLDVLVGDRNSFSFKPLSRETCLFAAKTLR